MFPPDPTSMKLFAIQASSIVLGSATFDTPLRAKFFIDEDIVQVFLVNGFSYASNIVNHLPCALNFDR